MGVEIIAVDMEHSKHAVCIHASNPMNITRGNRKDIALRERSCRGASLQDRVAAKKKHDLQVIVIVDWIFSDVAGGDFYRKIVFVWDCFQ